jgi:hypothetical protein
MIWANLKELHMKETYFGVFLEFGVDRNPRISEIILFHAF